MEWGEDGVLGMGEDGVPWNWVRTEYRGMHEDGVLGMREDGVLGIG